MNRIYRIVFNRTLGAPQVVSELASAPGGAVVGAVAALPKMRFKSRVLAAAVGLALVTAALPTRAQICASTSGTISTSCAGTTSNNGGSQSNSGQGGSPAAAGSGTGGTKTGTAGAGGAFGGNGGAGINFVRFGIFTYASGGGGGGVNGGGGGAGYNSNGVYTGGGGSGGLAALSATGSLSVNAGVGITGGAGGAGASVNYGGGGGGAGAGVSFALGNASITNAGSITGGAGGAGGTAPSGNYVYAGGGGGGGMGLSVGGSGNQVVNTSTGLIVGGNGGNGGIGRKGNQPFSGYSGSGGGGGAGLSVTGNGNTITNAGGIAGGNGGTSLASAGAGGFGVGISGNNNTLVSSGSISGGLDGNNANRNYAVDITGSNNTLELLSGYGFTGNVFSTAGLGNTLDLDGSTNASFNAGSLAGGFDTYQKNGASTWTLTGATSLLTPWIINNGTLLASSDASLGSTSGTITLNGGTLALSASGDVFDLKHAVMSNSTSATIQSGNLTLDAQVTNSAGTLTLLSTGSITEGTGAISADTLTGTVSNGNVTLGNANNAISTLAAFSADAFTLNDSSALNVTGDLTTGSGAISLNSQSQITLSGNLNSGAGVTSLTAPTIIQNSGVITAATLNVSMGSNATFSDANQVSALGNVTGQGDFSFNNAIALRITGLVSATTASFTDTNNTITVTGSVATVNTTIGNGTIFQIGSGGTSGSISGNVADSGELSFDRSDAVTFAGMISGAGLLRQSGSGTTTLTGANSLTGTTAIDSGTLALSGNGSIANSSVYDAGTFDISNTFAGASIASLDGGGAVNLGTRTLTLTAAQDSFSGVISGSGGLNVAGGEALTGDNTYTGGTTINAGASLLVGNGGTSGSITGDLVDNGAIVFARSNGLTFNGIISGSGDFYQNGAGTLTLTGNSTYTGITYVNFDGMLALSGSGSIAGSTQVQIEGTLDLSGTSNGASITSLEGSGAVDLGAKSLTLGADTRESGFDGVISGTGSLTLAGGYVFLAGANTYSGGTTIDDGAILFIGNSGTTGSIVGDVTDNGGLFFNRSDALTFAGVISGSGTLDQDCASTVTLTGDNTYTGQTSIDYGTLQVGNGGTTGSLAGDVATASGTTLAFDRSDATTFGGAITGLGSLAQIGTGTLILTGDSTYTGGTTIGAGTLQIGAGGTNGSLAGDVTDNGALVFDRSDAVTFAGMISGAGLLRQSGSGTTTLTGANLLTGTTAIDSGTLALSGNGSIANSSVYDAGTFDISNTFAGASIASLDGGGAVNLGTRTLTLTAAQDSFSGVISGSGGLDISGGATLTGDNTYTGGTTINAGASLSVGNGGTSGSITGDLVDNGIITFARSDGLTFNGIISGSGDFYQNGAGTLTLTGNSTYTGITYVNFDGTLALSGSGSIAGSTQVQIEGTLDLSGTSNGASITSLAGSGAVDLGAKSLTLVADTRESIFDGVISGTGSLTLAGGYVFLAGANTYSGGTTIDDGAILFIGNSGTTGSIVGDVVDNGGLFFNRSDALTFAGVISGSGTLDQASASTVTFTGDNTYTGQTSIDDGTLQVGDGGTTGSLAGDVATASGTTLAFDRSDATTFGGAITGSGSLAQIGTGTLILTGDSSYTGGTTIGAGILQVGNGGTTGSVASDITDNGALVFDRSDDVTFGNVVSGNGSLLQDGGGTLVLNGVNTYSGGTTVAAGKLLVGDSSNAGASIAGNVDVDAGATFGGHGTVAGDVTLVGGAHLAPGGSIGTLTVNGSLTVAQGGVLDYEFAAPGASSGIAGTGDQVNVGGNLTLNGATLNVNADPGFGQGLYTLFNYAGTLTETNGGIVLGSTPAGDTLAIQTLATAKQINLINSGGAALNIWNANGLASPTQIGGGSGTWSVTSSNWTDASGSTTAAMSPQPGFAIFGGAAGTVTVDNGPGAVSATGMQFAANGYVLTGGTLTLVGDAPTIRVGDGTTAGASDVAEIDNVLAGANGLVKTDLGTLVLAGTNAYTGGTTISAGTLQIGNGGTGGSVLGDIVDNGALAFDHADSVGFAGALSGTGSVTQFGSGTLTLTDSETYTGLTTISAGTLALSGSGGIADSSGVVDDGRFDISHSSGGASITSLSGSGIVNLGAQTLSLTGAADTFSGAISGTGGLMLAAGQETLTGVNTYTGDTLISGATLAIVDGGAVTGTGNVIDNGLLNVAGAGSAITATNGGTAFLVGSSGTGVLTASNGAKVASGGEFNIGQGMGDIGTVTITSGAALTAATSIKIGNGGSGSLTVSDGGAIDALQGNFSIADQAGSTGTVTVTGAGSSLGASAGEIAVGNAGTGTLTIADGGTVTGGSVVIAADAGSVGTLNIGAAAGDAAAGAGTLTAGSVNFGAGAGTLVFNHTSAGYVFASTISGAGVVDVLAGTTIFTGNNTYTGATTISGGILQIGNGGTAGSIAGAVVDDSALAFDRSDAVTFAGPISGTGSLKQAGSGRLILTGGNSYSGGTTISAGVLQIGNGGTTGVIVGDVTDNGALAFDRSDTLAFNGAISGSGALSQIGSGVLVLNGINAYLGGTTVAEGTLQIGDGAHANAVVSGDVDVDGGAVLGGHGTIAGNVDIAAGAHLAPGAGDIGMLTINGNLDIARGGVLDAAFGASGASFGSFGTGDSVRVAGDLTLDGATLNVSADPGFGAGLYNIISYGGNLNEAEGGIALGSVPTGDKLTIQILTGVKQINLLNTTGLTLNIWNGNGLASPTQMGGGNGIWSATATNWTDMNGDVTSSMQPQPGFAIFGGAAGTVTVDDGAGAVAASGMQFASGGYVLTGDALTLVADANGNAPTIRVGDGSSGSASDIATIDNVLVGSAGLNKSDYGILVLIGSSTYTGGTTISAGTLQLGNGGTTGSIVGNVIDGGVLAFDRSDALSFGGVISGGGGVAQTGNGTVTLSGSNSYTGLTMIGAGTLALSGAGSIAASSGVMDDSAFDISGTTSGASITSLSGSGQVSLGAQSLTLSNAADTFSGVITGAGGLTIGGGTEALTGSNTYTGGTTIGAGTLRIGSGGMTGSIIGNVADNGTLAFDRADNVVFAGAISRSGGVTQMSAGTLILTGSSTYTGGTTISAGTLQLGNGGTTGSIVGNVIDGGVLAFDRSDALSFGGAISGGGGVAQTGNGTVTLSGSNSYTGLTMIGAGTLALSGAGSIAASSGVMDDSAFDISGTTSGASITSLSGSGQVSLGAQSLTLSNAADTFSGAITGGGDLTIGGGAEVLTGGNTYTGGTTIGAGTLRIGSGGMTGSIVGNVADNGTLAFDRADDVVFAGAISGGGSLIQMGSGTLTLAGTDTYTGSTSVAAGTLDVTGSLAGTVSVAADAILAGSGSLGGITIASGGTVMPGGDGIGTLSVNGSVTLAAGSSYRVDATDTGRSDLIRATGAASLSGGSVVAVAAGSNWSVMTRYTILTAESGVTGTFGGATSNFAFLDPTLSYDADDAYLTLSRNAIPFPSVGVTPNETSTAGAVDALGSSSSIYSAVLPLAASPARAAFNQLAGDSLASARTAMIDDSQYVRYAINNHLRGVQGSGDIAQQDVDGSVWASVWGHGGNHDGDGNAARMGSNGSGLLVGTDKTLGTWRIGAIAGSGQLSNNTTYGAADAHSTDTVFGLYTGLDMGAWQFQGGAAHSWYETSSHRYFDIQGLGRESAAKYDSAVTQAYADGGYQFTFARGSLTPFTNMARVWVHQDAISEGGIAGLAVQANGTSVNYATVGLRGIYQPYDGLQLHASVGYQHAWGDLASVDQQRFASGGDDTFRIAGLPVSNNAGVVDLGMRFIIGKNVSVDASYRGQFAKDARDQGARMALTVGF